MSYCPNYYNGKDIVLYVQKYYIMITLFKDPFFQNFENVFESSRFLKTPETNVRKTETEYVVSISVPGLTKEDLKISTKEGILKIAFEKEEADNTHSFVGSFIKTYNVPDDVKEKDIEGKVENGVLILTLPIDKKKSLERTISLN
jgi:HSP20 family protein